MCPCCTNRAPAAPVRPQRKENPQAAMQSEQRWSYWSSNGSSWRTPGWEPWWWSGADCGRSESTAEGGRGVGRLDPDCDGGDAPVAEGASCWLPRPPEPITVWLCGVNGGGAMPGWKGAAICCEKKKGKKENKGLRTEDSVVDIRPKTTAAKPASTRRRSNLATTAIPQAISLYAEPSTGVIATEIWRSK